MSLVSPKRVSRDGVTGNEGVCALLCFARGMSQRPGLLSCGGFGTAHGEEFVE
jgi:hypothetical protein